MLWVCARSVFSLFFVPVLTVNKLECFRSVGLHMTLQLEVLNGLQGPHSIQFSTTRAKVVCATEVVAIGKGKRTYTLSGHSFIYTDTCTQQI
jgi:hypothetical protein